MSDASPDAMRDLVPGYALGALTPAETRAFEAALAGSPELRRELAEYHEVCALLAADAALAPSPGLKARLLERVRAESQTAAGARAAGIGPPPGGRALPRRRSIVPALLGLGLAASLLVAAGLLLQRQDLARRLAVADSSAADFARRLAGREATLNALLRPGVQLTTLAATGEQQPVVQVFWDRPANRLILHAVRLPPAPSGRAYQLWLMRRTGAPIASRVFDTGADGTTLAENIDVPPGEAIVGFAVSIEPAGGSAQPTTTPILFGTAQSE